MLPVSGPISFNDINVELGYSGTATLTLADALNDMGLGSDPDTMQECYGFDKDWGDVGNGWLEVTDAYVMGSPPSMYMAFDVYNNSMITNFTKTMYWRVRYMSSDVQTGTISSFTYNADTGYYKTSTTFTGGWPYDDCWVSWDNTNWISIPIT